jgi:hypothetical protein
VLRGEGLDDLAGLSLPEVRALRAACIEVETGLSYLRRMVQGRLDIVRREQRHREAGEHVDAATLVEELADVLGEGPRGGGLGRLSQTLEPTEVDPELSAELDALDAPGLDELDDAALSTLAEQLSGLERRISDRRQACFGPIDALQAEITRRYRDGEASVDALLAGD